MAVIVFSMRFLWTLCFNCYIGLLMEILSSCNRLVVLRATIDHLVTSSGISNRTKYFHLATLFTKSGNWGILNCLFQEPLFYRIKHYHLPSAFSDIFDEIITVVLMNERCCCFGISFGRADLLVYLRTFMFNCMHHLKMPFTF